MIVNIRLIEILQRIYKVKFINNIFPSQIYHRLISFMAGLKLKKLSVKCKSLEDLYKLIISFKYSFFKNTGYFIQIVLYQKKKEIIEFSKFYKSRNPKVILEIGTFDGGTLFFLSKCANPNAIIISIDLPITNLSYIIRKGEGYLPAKILFYKSFKSKNQKIFLIREDSHSVSAINEVEKILKGRNIDVIFIDGDHSYNGVKKDFENFFPYVKEDGIIAFHDIVKHLDEEKCQVSKFWNEIKNKFEHKEIISDVNEKWAGIGFLVNKIE